MSDERARLIGAAWTVLDRSGFEGFKVQLVMRETGMSARTFYRHFADKDALLVALLQDEMARAAAHLRTAVDGAGAPAEQVAAWIRHILSAAADPRRVARARLFSAQQSVMRRFPDEVAKGTALLLEPLQEAIARGIEVGDFPHADPARDARLVYSLTGNELTQALGEGAVRPVETVIEETTSFALRALGAAAR